MSRSPQQAVDLKVRYRLGTPEAIQLATALVDGARAFIGNTASLRAVKELDVILLEDLRRGASIASRRRE